MAKTGAWEDGPCVSCGGTNEVISLATSAPPYAALYCRDCRDGKGPRKGRPPGVSQKARFRHVYELTVRSEYDQPTTRTQLGVLLSNWDGAGDIDWEITIRSSVLSADA